MPPISYQVLPEALQSYHLCSASKILFLFRTVLLLLFLKCYYFVLQWLNGPFELLCVFNNVMQPELILQNILQSLLFVGSFFRGLKEHLLTLYYNQSICSQIIIQM